MFSKKLLKQVFHLHLFLGLQDLLRLRFHAPRRLDPHCSNRLRHYRLHLLPAQRGRLPVAVDQLPVGSLHFRLRLSLRHLLLLL